MGLTILQERRISLSKVISGTSLIAGTTIGAGMLGIPLVTAEAGFFPAACATIGVWIFMILTGLLYVEIALSLPAGGRGRFWRSIFEWAFASDARLEMPTSFR